MSESTVNPTYMCWSVSVLGVPVACSYRAIPPTTTPEKELCHIASIYHGKGLRSQSPLATFLAKHPRQDAVWEIVSTGSKAECISLKKERQAAGLALLSYITESGSRGKGRKKTEGIISETETTVTMTKDWWEDFLEMEKNIQLDSHQDAPQDILTPVPTTTQKIALESLQSIVTKEEQHPLTVRGAQLMEFAETWDSALFYCQCKDRDSADMAWLMGCSAAIMACMAMAAEEASHMRIPTSYSDLALQAAMSAAKGER